MVTSEWKYDFSSIGYGALYGFATFFIIVVITVGTGLGTYLQQFVPDWLRVISINGQFLHAIVVGQIVGGFTAGFLYEASPIRATIRGYLASVFAYLVPATLLYLLLGFSMFGVPRGHFFGVFYLVDWFVNFLLISSPLFLTSCFAALFGRFGQYVRGNYLTPGQLKQYVP